MIADQDILSFMRELAYRPMTFEELADHFRQEGSLEEVHAILASLEDNGYIIRTRKDRYGVPERMNLLRGRLQAHAKGFAFLIPDETDHPDVYIHANDLHTAMNGDIVLARVTSKSQGGARMEGEVVRVVKRAIEQVVGVFENLESYGFVMPDDRRINRDVFIPKGAFHGAVTGQKVVAKIVNYPEGRAAAEGEIIEILGHKDDPGVDILSIIRKHKLPEAFPDEVMAEAEGVPDVISEEEIISQKRRDLRGLNIVTIDGEDAKDLDDAVYVEHLPNGNYKLGVHIADVGYYVKEGSELDREAYARGCSVYLVDRVIPMLPRRLSNGICSLNPRVDRLTLSCEMEFDEQAKLIKHEVFPSVIRTVERMTYTDVRKIVEDEDPEVSARYSYMVDSFKLMKKLALKLRKKRMHRGAIDFDFEESKVIVDENGKPTDIIKRERSIAEQMIEEFMLAANETVAEHFHWLRVPFLYRIHEDPDSEKLLHFMSFVANFGYVVRGRGNSVHPRSLQTLLEEIEGTREQTVISTMMLRSMRQAKYDAESTGHFGLAAEYYTHFTSPIRRYPDLVIHRVIREVFNHGGSLPEKRLELLKARMPEIAQQSSERERVAVEAERDTEQLKKAEYMLDKVGEEYVGIISSVTSFGMFIELDNTVEGLIRLSDMADDYYHFDEQHMQLIGERTANIHRIGDEVKIRVARVNMDDHTIDFEMVDSARRHGTLGDKLSGYELKKRSHKDRAAKGEFERGGRGTRGGRAGDSRGARGAAGREDSRGARGQRSGAQTGGGRGQGQPWKKGQAGGFGRAGSQGHAGGESVNIDRQHDMDNGSQEPSEGEWVNRGEHRSRRYRDRQDAQCERPKKGKSGINFGGGHDSGRSSHASTDDANWVDRLIEQAEHEESDGGSFDFGSGRGGYGRPAEHGGGHERRGGSGYGRGYNGGARGSGNNKSGGGKRGRKSTSESGIFIGEGAAKSRQKSGSSPSKKGKSNNSTAKFVRKKKR
ncbi:MAG: ribonuclease R [Paenibacillus sp.]|nr:ribonuclease R [Paenibacillus sp.]